MDPNLVPKAAPAKTGEAEIIEGRSNANGLRFAVVVSRFNDFITNRLLEGCLSTLKEQGADLKQVQVIWCPGAFEIPMVAKQAALSKRHDVIICLGAVIRGETAHFDFVAGESARGIAQVSLETGVPTIFGVITTDTVDQAMARAGDKLGNKGSDAALAAIEMVNLLAAMKNQTVAAIR